jgi:hypothetical protein
MLQQHRAAFDGYRSGTDKRATDLTGDVSSVRRRIARLRLSELNVGDGKKNNKFPRAMMTYGERRRAE